MKYFGNWSNYSDMAKELYYPYEKTGIAPIGAPTDDEILFAVYGTQPYEGYALIVYERDGRLYELNGSHCSCYGLNESMSNAEETSREALKIRKLSSYEFGDDAVARFAELFQQT